MPADITTTIVKWEDIVAQIPGPRAKLNDVRIGLDLASAAVVSPISLSDGVPLAIEVGADTTARIDAFNAADETDPDGVIGGDEAPLRFDSRSAWLKYSIQATARATVDLDAGAAASQVQAAEQVRLSDYRRHSSEETAVVAIPRDIERPRLIALVDSVRALQPGDALVLRTAGTLRANIEVSWGDVFTSEIGSLARLLRSPAPIGIQIDAGLKVNASLSVNDEFTLTFTRDDGRAGYRVFVRKATISSARATAAVTATIHAAQPQVVSAAVNGLLDGELSTVRALLARATGALTPSEQQLIEDVAERLGVGNLTPAALSKAIDTLESTVADKIAGAVKTKIETGFAFEYGRIGENSTLLQATLTDEALAAAHAPLLRRNLAPVLAAPKGVAIEKYLNEKSVTRTRAWGFTLGIGDARLFSKDTSRSTRVIREGTPGTWRSYAVLHAYDMTRRNWSMSLNAQTPSFVPPGAPVTAASFAYGLHLLSSEQPKVFDQQQSDYCADMAVLWGVCREGQADALKRRFPAIGTKDVLWAVQMTINDEALKKELWARLAALSAVDFAAALAAAVEWNRAVPGTIESVARRRQLYFPVWQHYLQNPLVGATGIAQFAYDHLRGDAPATSRLEKGGFATVDDRLTAAGLADKNDDTRPDIADFLRGAKNLADALASPTDERGVIEKSFQHMSRMSDESHQVRALGVLLLDLARKSVYLPGVTRTLSFTSGDKTTVLSSNDF
jgi:hypothetical protein